MTDAIFALATAPGRAAVAVMRISGPGARDVLEALAGDAPRPRQASLRVLSAPDGEVLDRALILWFPAPASYTGEDSAELHLHGGPGVVDRVTGALLALGARLAEPGEFTRRAFENGKFDLDQAEAVADLVDAETAAQARQALGQLEGQLGARHRAWRERLIEALARLEAEVDFPDETAPASTAQAARRSLERLAADLDLALADEARGRRVREGYRIAVIGAPNSGKSSLINAITGCDVSIVTGVPGTTRDAVEAQMVLGGYKVLLADTAGIRRTRAAIEREGVRRARARAEAADLRLWVVDRSAYDGAWRQALPSARAGDFCILNKSDLPPGSDAPAAARAAGSAGLNVLSMSVLRDGADALCEDLIVRVRHDLAGSDFPAATRARHNELLHEARRHLGRAIDSLSEPELAAEDVRLAARALARVSGQIDAEEILGRVFATFCIGK